MNKYINFSELDKQLIKQYRQIFESAFPPVILNSKIVQNCWNKVFSYFPDYQIILLDHEGQIIGFINTVPLFWDKPLTDLPDTGWDWLIQKSITDYENNIQTNILGGLQVVVSKKNLGKGFSKQLIAEGKAIQNKHNFQNFIIPIRPTLKWKYPKMAMKEYMHVEKDGQIYDPWIRTHIKSGAQIIKVCSNSMKIQGDLSDWEKIMNQKISKSGMYEVEGALNLVHMDIEKDEGVYNEENIWIKY